MMVRPKLRLDLPLQLPRIFPCHRTPHHGQERRAIRLLGTQAPVNGRQTFLSPQPDLRRSTETNRLNIQLDVVRSVDRPRDVSLPAMIYFYSPWSLLTSKLSLLKLKLLWDWGFSEARFLENSRQAALIITDFVRRHRSRNVERCSTPMGYKQISHDLIDGARDWRLNMMRFERQHIYRSIPLKVQLLRHYGHKFAFIDVVYVALRRTNDFSSSKDLDEVQLLMRQHSNKSQLTVDHPLIFAEIFVRYRRDYSTTPTPMGNVRENSRCMGQWLVSTYKILQFDSKYKVVEVVDVVTDEVRIRPPEPEPEPKKKKCWPSSEKYPTDDMVNHWVRKGYDCGRCCDCNCCYGCCPCGYCCEPACYSNCGYCMSPYFP